jgi:hypothetical protein
MVVSTLSSTAVKAGGVVFIQIDRDRIASIYEIQGTNNVG